MSGPPNSGRQRSAAFTSSPTARLARVQMKSEKTGERIQAPHKRFLLDLLADIVADISVENVYGVICLGVDLRQQAETEDAAGILAVAEFRRREREELAVDGASREQIGVEPLQLARARTTQRELVIATVFGDESMDFIQQGRQTLHLVYDDPATSRPSLHLLTEGFRLPCQLKQRVHPEQIEPQRLRQNRFQPGRFPGSSRTKQEKRVVGQLVSPLKHPQQINGKNAGSLSRNAAGFVRTAVIDARNRSCASIFARNEIVRPPGVA